MTTSHTKTNDNILGYILEGRIGAGGYGEVWKARAPGGLPKAVKIIFGFHDDTRARSELKALQKVKELRHPFLMSLERIEVFEGQLVVVSELADRSLTERFLECQRQGHAGIPREELLQYMRDAADGLDFLCNKHLLQHLDVKPENLLIVGEHVKVGDYGLVRDIRNCTQSLMGGMTPTYAAPELFEGQPSQLSDQYSLAIVYQEMLTGVRPYDGNSPAELARQHMLGRPNLEPLARGDQAVVAKALAKDTSLRFRSCTEFVAELSRRKNHSGRRSVTEPLPRAGRDSTTTPDPTMVLTSAELSHQRSTKSARRIAPIACDGSQAAFHPTLLIGVGRTGALSLQMMKERLFQRFGRADELSALHMLCLDTDFRDLCSITNSDETARFRDEEILSIQLQNSDVYRKSAKKFARWLSRRWIYNIPRSFTTEGIRPLGRLAFADHVEAILDRLHVITQKMTNEENLKQSAKAVQLPAHWVPRVYILGSISGGVGSGIIADLAYAVRSVLMEHGCPDSQINGILLHGSGKTASEGGLSHSNAYACLRELCHYAKLGYPGDESIGLPNFDGDDPAAFSDLYLLHCGTEDYARYAAEVADYLYLDVATGCNDFFKRCRRGKNEDGKIRLRTFGISQMELHQERIRARFSGYLLELLFNNWLHNSETNKVTFDVDTFVETLTTENNICLDKVLQTGFDVSVALYGDQLSTRLTEVANEISTELASEALPEQRAKAANQAIDRFLASVLPDDNNPAATDLDELLSNPTRQLTAKLWSGVSDLIDIPNVRLAGARSAHEKCQRIFEQIYQQVEEHLRCLRNKIQSKLTADESISNEELADLRSQELALRCASRLARNLQTSSRDLCLQFNQVEDLLETSISIAETKAKTSSTPLPSGPDYSSALAALLNQQLALFVTQLEEHIDRNFLQTLGGLRYIAESGVNTATQLVTAVQTESRRLVAGSLQGINFDVVLDQLEPNERHLMTQLQVHLQQSLPRLTDCGGAVRLVLAVPVETQGQRLGKCLQRLFKESPTILPRTDGDVSILFEGEGVSAESVALRLIEERPEATEYIERIASRLDVEWLPLTGLG